MTPQSDFLRIITERGYMHQATQFEGLDERAQEQCIPAYIGFDCTADSLHVGSLVQIMMLRILQQTGHKPIVLMGAAQQRLAIHLAKIANDLCYLTLRLKKTKKASAKFLKNT